MTVENRHDAADVVPAYAFGFGLSYTTFNYADLTVVGVISATSNATVSFTLTNVGKRAGVFVCFLRILCEVSRTILCLPVCACVCVCARA